MATTSADIQAAKRVFAEIIGEHGDHPDMMEGATAFVEKRKPRWAGFSE